MKPQELNRQLSKIQIDHKNIQIDLEIFNGLDNLNSINRKF